MGEFVTLVLGVVTAECLMEILRLGVIWIARRWTPTPKRDARGRFVSVR